MGLQTNTFHDMNTTNTINAGYSLHDLVEDIRKGKRDTFDYGRKTYRVRPTKSKPGYWIIHPDGQAGWVPAILTSMNIHGIAAFLNAHPEERNYHFNAEGNVIAPNRWVERNRI